MDKDTALLEQQISKLTDDVIRYQYAYDILMEHFDDLPDEVKSDMHVKLAKVNL